MNSGTEYIGHKEYFNELRTLFSREFIDNVDSKRRTELPEARRQERIKTFFNTVIPSLLSKCSNCTYFCMFQECQVSFLSFNDEFSLVRHLINRHKEKIPALGNFMATQYSLNYHLACKECEKLFELEKEAAVSSTGRHFHNFQLAIKYTHDWHDLADAKTYSQPFESFFTLDDTNSIESWGTDYFCTLKRDLTLESFTEIKRKK
jgi:hypothetical protein